MEIKAVELSKFQHLLEESIHPEMSDLDIVTIAELILGLAVDRCQSVQNFTSQVMKTEDGRFLHVTCEYADSLGMQYFLANRQNQAKLALAAYDMLSDLMKKLVVPDDANVEVAEKLEEIQSVLKQVRMIHNAMEAKSADK